MRYVILIFPISRIFNDSESIIFYFNSEKQTQSSQVVTEKGESELSRAHFLLLEAFDEDEAGNAEEAIELYSSAVELCLEAVSLFNILGLIILLNPEIVIHTVL